MFAGLIEKLQRQRRSHRRRSGGGRWRRSWTAARSRRRSPASSSRLAMKGERPDEIVGLARTMRARATQLCAIVRAGVRHVRHRRRRRAYVQRLDRRGARAGGVRRPRREARQPQRVEPVRQRRSVRGARRRTSPPAPAIVERCLDECRDRVPLRAGVPSVDEARGGRRGRSWASGRAFNLLGPLTNPAGASRQLVGVPRPELTELVARSLAQLGAERAWVVHGADGLDEISTTGYTEVSECRERRGEHASTCIRGTWACRKPRRRRCAAGTPPTTRPSPGQCWPSRTGARARSCSLNAGAALLIAGKGADHSRRHRHGGRGDRQRPRRRGARAARVLQCRAGGGRMTTTRDVFIRQGSGRADLPRDDRRRGARGLSRCGEDDPLPRVRWRQRRRTAGPMAPAGSCARCATAPAPRVIAECKRRSPSRGILREDYDPAASRAGVRGGGRGGDLRC